MRSPSPVSEPLLSRPLLRTPQDASDAESATLRSLPYGRMPAWFVVAAAEWWQQRRTDIEHTPARGGHCCTRQWGDRRGMDGQGLPPCTEAIPQR